MPGGRAHSEAQLGETQPTGGIGADAKDALGFAALATSAFDALSIGFRKRIPGYPSGFADLTDKSPKLFDRRAICSPYEFYVRGRNRHHNPGTFEHSQGGAGLTRVQTRHLLQFGNRRFTHLA